VPYSLDPAHTAADPPPPYARRSREGPSLRHSDRAAPHSIHLLNKATPHSSPRSAVGRRALAQIRRRREGAQHGSGVQSFRRGVTPLRLGIRSIQGVLTSSARRAPPTSRWRGMDSSRVAQRSCCTASPSTRRPTRPTARRLDEHSSLRHSSRQPSATRRAFHQTTDGRCFKCLARGHRANSCHDPVRCLLCFRSGHRASE
jgi:hypothetical protein